jgi:dihydroorotate dehydrogenase
VPLIGVGGVDSGERALAKLQAGATLLQLYTGLVYQGPALFTRIKQALIAHMERERMETAGEITGTRAQEWADVRIGEGMRKTA